MVEKKVWQRNSKLLRNSKNAFEKLSKVLRGKKMFLDTIKRVMDRYQISYTAVNSGQDEVTLSDIWFCWILSLPWVETMSNENVLRKIGSTTPPQNKTKKQNETILKRKLKFLGHTMTKGDFKIKTKYCPLLKCFTLLILFSLTT